MKQAFGLIRRPWGVFYLKHKITGQQTSLKTSDKAEAQRILQAHNESECQPHFNLSLARVYLNGADPKLATRTWQDVMDNIVSKKLDSTRSRWAVAIKDKNLDCLRKLSVCETRPEHFDRVLADGKVSTNVYLRRIHNHALGMEWLLKSVIPRLQWPGISVDMAISRNIVFAFITKRTLKPNSGMNTLSKLSSSFSKPSGSVSGGSSISGK